MLYIKYVPINRLTSSQKVTVKKLQKECFSDVPQQSINEDFIAKEFGKIFAYKDQKIVGMVGLFKREVYFEGRKITLGGMGGNLCNQKISKAGNRNSPFKRRA